jgi:hypothetical protein
VKFEKKGHKWEYGMNPEKSGEYAQLERSYEDSSNPNGDDAGLLPESVERSKRASGHCYLGQAPRAFAPSQGINIQPAIFRTNHGGLQL